MGKRFDKAARKRPLKILLSARDPGATENVIQLLRLMAADPMFEPVVAASGTASLQMTDRGIPHMSFSLPGGQDHIRGEEDAGPLLEAAGNLCHHINPDKILVSLSSFGAGIDEALIAVAKVPVFALQDSWGDINNLLGKTADLYFVLDTDARKMSIERFGVKAEPTGMPKYVKYRGLDFSEVKVLVRRELMLCESERLLGWFGQSNMIPGYESVLLSFFRAVERLPSKVRVFIKSHPKFLSTGEGEAERAREVLAERVVGYAPEVATESLLAAADLVVTPFSLCGLDHAVMSSMSPTPIGSVVYLMNNSPIRRFARENLGRIDFPIVGNQGVGTCLTSADPDIMANHFLREMAAEHATRYHQRSRQVLPQFDYNRFREILLDWK